MRGLDVHENIDVSATKLMLSLRVCFISSDLTANKLFPINPRAVTGPPKMSLLLEVESTPALIIEPRLILVTYTDDLGGYITSNQQLKDARSKPPQDCQKTKCYARADPTLHHRLCSKLCCFRVRICSACKLAHVAYTCPCCVRVRKLCTCAHVGYA